MRQSKYYISNANSFFGVVGLWIGLYRGLPRAKGQNIRTSERCLLCRRNPEMALGRHCEGISCGPFCALSTNLYRNNLIVGWEGSRKLPIISVFKIAPLCEQSSWSNWHFKWIDYAAKVLGTCFVNFVIPAWVRGVKVIKESDHSCFVQDRLEPF